MIQNGYGAVGILSGLPQPPMTPLIQRNQRIEGEGREAFFIMKYYISLFIIAVIAVAAYKAPEPPKPVPVKVTPPEPIGAVGAESEPPAASF